VVAIPTAAGKPRPAHPEDLGAAVRAHLLGAAAPPARFTPKGNALGSVSGQFRLAAYTTALDDTVRWICIDIDGGGHSNPVKDPDQACSKVLIAMRETGLIPYAEKSRSGTGWHVWAFFRDPVPAAAVRSLFIPAIPRVTLEDGSLSDVHTNKGIEFFPKQDRLRGEKLGNCVWLPLWHGAPPGANRFFDHSSDGLEIHPDCPSIEFSPAPDRSAPRRHDDLNVPALSGTSTPKAPSAHLAPNASAVFEGCRFIRHCDENQETLSEPTWFAALGVVAHVEDGAKHCHAISNRYPGYSFQETQARFERTVSEAGARTCADIGERWEGCKDCPDFRRVRSPIEIGLRASARSICSDVVTKVADDHGVMWEEKSLAALACLRSLDKPEFERVRRQLQKQKVRVSKLDRDIDDYARRVVGSDREQVRPSRYVIDQGHHAVLEPDTGLPLPLSNFQARIVGDEVHDDGVNQGRFFEIVGSLDTGENLGTVTVDAKEFEGLQWIPPRWGSKPFVVPAKFARDHLANAIRTNSPEATSRRVFSHTGWRRCDDEWLYLHAGGALGATGNRGDVSVSLIEGRLSSYDFSEAMTAAPSTADVATTIEQLTELGPSSVVGPLIASAVCAAIVECMPVDFSIFVYGTSGTFKSETTALIQNFFGARFDGKSLPANWSSTENSIERALFLAKDAITVVDDFCPKGSPQEVGRLNQKAERVLRNIGNRTGRGRLRSDLRARADFLPRGLAISSGEDVPRGQSLLARAMTLRVSPGVINKNILTSLQGSRVQLNYAMAKLICWLAPRIDDLKCELPKRREKERSRLSLQGHARTADIVAALLCAVDVLLEHFDSTKFMSSSTRVSLGDFLRTGIAEAGRDQADLHEGEDMARTFITLMVASLASGFAYLDSPEDSEWLKHIAFKFRGPGSIRIGFANHRDEVVVEPNAALAAVNRLSTSQGNSFCSTITSVGKRLVEAGFIQSETDKNSVKRTDPEDGIPKRSWVFRTEFLEPMLRSLHFPDKTLEKSKEPLGITSSDQEVR